jgi:hypothetical protein
MVNRVVTLPIQFAGVSLNYVLLQVAAGQCLCAHACFRQHFLAVQLPCMPLALTAATVVEFVVPFFCRAVFCCASSMCAPCRVSGC